MKAEADRAALAFSDSNAKTPAAFLNAVADLYRAEYKMAREFDLQQPESQFSAYIDAADKFDRTGSTV